MVRTVLYIYIRRAALLFNVVLIHPSFSVPYLKMSLKINIISKYFQPIFLGHDFVKLNEKMEQFWIVLKKHNCHNIVIKNYLHPCCQ